MERALWLGIDVGTQSVRALAATSAGEVVARAAVALSSHRDGVRHEQDPESWWSALVRATQVVTREVDADEIRGVACCATSGTVLYVDPDGEPVTPGLMYDDGRAEEQSERAGVPASWGLAKALWLLENASVPSGARLAHQVDLITRRLVGEPVPTDWSNALKSGVDPTSGTWPLERLERLGLGADRLPDVVPPGTPIGVLGADAATATGIPEGTAVLAGLTDGCAAQVAAGALRVGDWNFVLGTTLVLKGCTPTALADPTGAVYSHRSPEGTWWPGGASSAGAGVLAAWFPDRELAELDAAAAEREPSRCLAYPLLGRGERFPFRHPEAEGFVVGDPRDEADRYAAVLQAVAFLERLSLEHVSHLGADVGTTVSLTGGGASSPYWCQLQADVLGREVVIPAIPDGALGMAVVAASAEFGSLTAAAEAMVSIRERFVPRDGATQRWERRYADWRTELADRGWC